MIFDQGMPRRSATTRTNANKVNGVGSFIAVEISPMGTLSNAWSM